MIEELAVFPQVTYTVGQGQIGTRKWLLDAGDNIETFVDSICDSHWPGRKDSLPIDVQYGPQNKDTVIKRDMATNPLYRETIGGLVNYGKTLVVAKYALHRVQNCWPDHLGPKPYHPPNTTLSIKVKGGGQTLLVSPAGMQGMAPDAVLCGTDAEGVSPGLFGKVVIPIIDYQIACARLTRTQIAGIFAQYSWDLYGGRVNWLDPKEVVDPDILKYEFLAAPHGTLLFDGYSMEEMFACNADDPFRYRLTARFKRRVIMDNDPDSDGYNMPLVKEQHPVGWNHDYINIHSDNKLWDWKYIKIRQGEGCVPRYEYCRGFDDIFVNGTEAKSLLKPNWDDCDEADDVEDMTPMSPCDPCSLGQGQH